MSDYQFSIEAETRYLEQQSSPEEDRFAFAYQITIRNTGSRTAQLLARHWVITDANHAEQEVHGSGVVGEQPSIEPGHSFVYTSGVVLETPLGTMQGEYQMLGEDGDTFEAPIAPFLLARPNEIH